MQINGTMLPASYRSAIQAGAGDKQQNQLAGTRPGEGEGGAQAILDDLVTLRSMFVGTLQRGGGGAQVPFEELLVALLKSGDRADFLRRNLGALELREGLVDGKADEPAALTAKGQEAMARINALADRVVVGLDTLFNYAAVGDRPSVEALLELSQAAEFPELAASARKMLLDAYRDNDGSSPLGRDLVEDVLLSFVDTRLAQAASVASEGVSPSGLLTGADFVYLAGVSDRAPHYPELRQRCEQWLQGRPGLARFVLQPAPEAAPQLLAPTRYVEAGEIASAVDMRLPGLFGTVVWFPTEEAGAPCTFPSLGEDAILETALTKLATRAAPDKPAFTFVFDQEREHWVLLLAVKEGAEDPARFIIFDSNVSGNMMDSVGYRLGQKIEAFVGPLPVTDLVLKNLQHAKAANACAPLCLEALEFALGEHQQDDNALTSVGIQASLTQFAQAFDDLPQPDRDAAIRVARARIMESAVRAAEVEVEAI